MFSLAEFTVSITWYIFRKIDPQILRFSAYLFAVFCSLRSGPCKNRPLEFCGKQNSFIFFLRHNQPIPLTKIEFVWFMVLFKKKLGGESPGRSKAVMIVSFKVKFKRFLQGSQKFRIYPNSIKQKYDFNSCFLYSKKAKYLNSDLKKEL